MDNHDFAAIIGPVARRLLGEPNKRLSKRNELRFGTHGSMAVNLVAGTWFDHENNVGGGTLDLIEYKERCDRAAAFSWLKRENFNGFDSRADGDKRRASTNSNKRRTLVAMYDYKDEQRLPIYQVVRFEPKEFRQRRPGGKLGWIWDLDGVRRVLYRLPELLEAVSKGEVILVVEGEKDVAALVELGLAATCNSGGANNWQKDAQYNEPLRGADVVLIPDADEAGWKHVNLIGSILTGIAARIRVLMLPDAKDAAEWIGKGGTREKLDELIGAAPDWVAPPADDPAAAAAKAKEDELLDAMAKTRPGVEYARKRKQAAKALRVPQADVDAEVEHRRVEGEMQKVAPLYGHWNTDPWPEVVDGDALLRDIIFRIRRHVVISYDNALAIALWLMFSWVHDAVAVHSPILNVTSAEPDSGKSTTMGVIAFLMPRCIATIDISKAALYRGIKLWNPTFCIDEFDDVLAGATTDENKAELRSIINGGHTRGTIVLRCIGENKIPEPFPTFCAKAIGMIGRKMPSQTLGRCIIIEMRRRKGSEPIERFKHVDDADLAQLRSRLLRWSIDNEDALTGVDPTMPSAFQNRRADNWRVQLAIADLCGGDWGDKARAAAAKLEGSLDKLPIGAQLLADIRKVLNADGLTDRAHSILSAVLVEKLCEDQDSPWVEYSRGQKITQTKLARLLRGYGITSGSIRIGAVTGKGYRRWQFEEAWEIYLPSEPSNAEEEENSCAP
jgi:hypothetical protein